MNIREAKLSDLDAWVKLRGLLWPKSAEDALRKEAIDRIEAPDEVCFLAISPNDNIVGFAEAALYTSPNGPYGHLEGWFVMPEFRGQGYGKELVGNVEQWCLHQAICLLTSDTTPDYPTSPAAHAGSGFKKLHEFTIFMKELRDSPESDNKNAGPED